MHPFIIKAESPEAIHRKLKEEHPLDWQDAMRLGVHPVPRKGLLGFFKKQMYEERFIIVKQASPAKGRKIDEIRRWLASKAESSNPSPQSLVEGPVRRSDERKDFPSRPEDREDPAERRPVSGLPEEKPVLQAGSDGRSYSPRTAVSQGAGFIREIGEIRRTVSLLEDENYPASIMPDPVLTQGTTAARIPDPAEDRWVRLLVKADVGEKTASEIASAVRSFGSVPAALGGLLKFRGPVTLAENERKIVLFVGPTGVGKTTTLVKVCADFYRRRVPIRFMTIDTYRIGATGQLESYAEIIRAPLDIVKTAEEFRAKLEASTERIIFTDTAGRSPRDEERKRELLSFIRAVPEGFTKEVYLILSATTATAEMEEITKRFAEFSLSGVIITKTDEPERNGRTVDYLRRSGLPLAYFTNGQSVPEDLTPAGPESLTRLVLPGGEGSH